MNRRDGITRGDGMQDIDDLIGRSLRERAARGPGRAPGIAGVRRRVRRRQQRHAVLAVAPMALMSTYLITRDGARGVLPASGGATQADPLGTAADSVVPPTTACGVAVVSTTTWTLPASTELGVSTSVLVPTTAPDDAAPDCVADPAAACGWTDPGETEETMALSEELMAAINAGEETLPEWFNTTTLAPCVIEPTTTRSPESTVTTIECIGVSDPCAPPSTSGFVEPTSTFLPQTTTAQVLGP